MRKVGRLFWEFFRIALLVVGGGYAIAAVADDVFGRKLKWLREGEILDHLPVISSVPGLVAGNTAIYVGLKTAGRLGAVAALVAVALPSYLIFSAVTIGFARLPQDNVWLEGAFLGLRSSLTGIIAGTIWRTVRKGGADWRRGLGVELGPLTVPERVASGLLFGAALALAAAFCWQVLVCFLGFGCVCIGGGFPLVPVYMQAFVGPDAPLLGMSPADFSNLMALTQMTPGPVSVNAATFFGHRLSGPVGGLVATAALLTPSYFLMTAVLTGLAKGRESRVAHVAVACLKPVAVSLMAVACWRFAGLSVWETVPQGGVQIHPLGAVLAAFSAGMLVARKLSIMTLVFICAGVGALTSEFDCVRGDGRGEAKVPFLPLTYRTEKVYNLD